MTTARQPPVLDRLISREVVGSSPGVDPFGQPLPGPVTTVGVWAARRDFRARDMVASVAGGLVTITDSRYVVRHDASHPWRVWDEFVDEEGYRRTVRGVSEIADRNRYLELLARRIG